MHVRALAVALCLAPGLAAPAAGADLEARLGAALAHPGLAGAEVGALVVRASDGGLVFARQPERPLVPASNQKVLTALAALETFGPTHQFVTRVWADRAPGPDGAVSVLAVEGGGDPGLTSEQLWRLASDLRLAGLRRVSEGILVDDAAFGDGFWHEAWGEISTRAYHGPVGALNANYGAYQLEVRPGARSGEPVTASLDPPVPYLALALQAQTRAAGTPAKLVVDRAARDGGGEAVRLSGALPLGAQAQVFRRAVGDPALYAGAVLRMQLEAVGIAVEGGVRRGRPPAGARELLAFEGLPLGQLVSLFVKWSNNTIAETLQKAMGRAATGEPGTWENGRRAALASLGRLGIDTSGLVMVDGSGLARGNRVAARTLVDALRVARGSFRFGPELVAALPIAAGDGTLEKRAAGAAGAVRAKTGLLDGVTGLSGFAIHPEQGELVFSILVNGARRGDEAAMAGVDAFAAALVAGAPGQDAGRRAP
jgi:D-alanyl-D-alanine carboxypeptidase/D-alanyl-D-alanine-endopeptidase (penicillin-binding protein 4)